MSDRTPARTKTPRRTSRPDESYAHLRCVGGPLDGRRVTFWTDEITLVLKHGQYVRGVGAVPETPDPASSGRSLAPTSEDESFLVWQADVAETGSPEPPVG